MAKFLKNLICAAMLSSVAAPALAASEPSVLVARAAPVTALLAAVTVAAAAATGDWLAGAEPVPGPPDELAEAVGTWASCAEPPWLRVLVA